MASLIKKTTNWGWLAYSSGGSVHYHHEGEHGNVKTDMVLELGVLYLAGNRKLTATLKEA